MIRGIHAMFYSSHADELRDFLRDKLAFPFTDVGDGWLIFDAAEGDIGCHPTDGTPPSGTHDVSFYCDDIEATVAELRGRGVKFVDEIADQGWGRACHFEMPGGVEVMLYQPHYQKRRAPEAGKGAAVKRTRAKRAAPAARNAVKRRRKA